MSILHLSKGERFIYDWQFRRGGDFATRLAGLLSVCDSEGFVNMAKAYPEETEAMVNYQSTSGWWDGVLKKKAEVV